MFTDDKIRFILYRTGVEKQVKGQAGMKIYIYYGGRGLMDDPTLYVINKMQEVLDELHVSVKRFNLYEAKNSITTLPQTLKRPTALSLQQRWSGMESADICSSFLIPAGCMETRKRFQEPICALW